MQEQEYRQIRPWVRLAIAIAYDIAFSAIGVDDWSIDSAYVVADQHMTKLEQFPGTFVRDRDKL